jgi:hypothetical protein
MEIKYCFRLSSRIAFLFILSVLITPVVYGQGLVYSVPGMEKVKVHPDIVYKQDTYGERNLDIYTPSGLTSDARLPAVIFVHGGPLGENPPKLKNTPFFKSYGKLMAASGLVGVVIDHRFTSIDKKALDTTFADIEESILFVKSISASYNIDPDRIALWVFSGGGTCISIPMQKQMKFIRCMVSYYGVPDINILAKLEGKTAPQSVEKYNPATYLTKDYEYRLPLLIARAGKDKPEINQSIDDYFSRMLSLNSDISLLNHPSGFHGFDSRNDDEQSRFIIKTTILFLKRHLGL